MRLPRMAARHLPWRTHHRLRAHLPSLTNSLSRSWELALQYSAVRKWPPVNSLYRQHGQQTRPEVPWSFGSSSLPCGPSTAGCNPASAARRTMSVSHASSKPSTNSNPDSKTCTSSKPVSTSSKAASPLPLLPRLRSNPSLRHLLRRNQTPSFRPLLRLLRSNRPLQNPPCLSHLFPRPSLLLLPPFLIHQRRCAPLLVQSLLRHNPHTSPRAKPPLNSRKLSAKTGSTNSASSPWSSASRSF